MNKDKKIQHIKNLSKKGEVGLFKLWEMLQSPDNKTNKDMARSINKLADAIEQQNKLKAKELKIENRKVILEARRLKNKGNAE